ncbi:MAG: tyrosinase family protein, partial [Bryobacterales bacterium]|nr:tyrosinase family protein [Bryobacterales bacterium]
MPLTSTDTSSPATSRYQRFQQIMREAAGSSPADYGGLGPFWDLPLAKLVEASVHGLRLIAPAEAAKPTCCHATNDGQQSRAERSALIQGLRAQPPFDGSRFPRLPWGGRAVSDDDVQMIAEWINDGCPPQDREIASFTIINPSAPVSIMPLMPKPQPESVRVEGRPPGHEFTPREGGANEYLFEQGEVKQRMNIDCMTPVQIEKFRFAMRELYELNKWPEDARNYNNLALIHQNHCQHGWERFLPWHRIYLYEFELALQDRCPDVTMPYWDWTMPQYCPETPEKGWIIPRALQAFLTGDSLTFLAAQGVPPDQIEQLKPMVGVPFASQRRFFDAAKRATGIDYSKTPLRPRFIDALLASNSLWYPLRYPAEYQDSSGHPSTLNKVIHYHYPTADDVAQILSLRTFRDFGGGSYYDDSFGFLDQNPHNTLHIWTGGMNPDAPPAQAPEDRNKSVRVAGRRFHSRDDLYSQPQLGDMFSNLTASYDPVFWPVHSNVDRLWWEWQQAHPNANPVELDAVLTPWSYTIRDTLDMQRFGYEYVKSTAMVPVGSGTPVGRFVSKEIAVPD